MTLLVWIPMSSSKQVALRVVKVVSIHLAKHFGANSLARKVPHLRLLEISKMFSKISRISSQWVAKEKSKAKIKNKQEG